MTHELGFLILKILVQMIKYNLSFKCQTPLFPNLWAKHTKKKKNILMLMKMFEVLILQKNTKEMSSSWRLDLGWTRLILESTHNIMKMSLPPHINVKFVKMRKFENILMKT